MHRTSFALTALWLLLSGSTRASLDAKGALLDVEILLLYPSTGVVHIGVGEALRVQASVTGASHAELCDHAMEVQVRIAELGGRGGHRWARRGPGNCHLPDPNSLETEVAVELEEVPFGRHRLSVLLMDSANRSRSISEIIVSVFARPPRFDIPDCWDPDAPIYLQSEECVWLMSAINPRVPVFLSQVELGVAGTPHERARPGIWGWITGSFGGIELEQEHQEEREEERGEASMEEGEQRQEPREGKGSNVTAEERRERCQGGGAHVTREAKEDGMLGRRLLESLPRLGQLWKVRMNIAPTEGREVDVGSRTDVRFLGGDIPVSEIASLDVPGRVTHLVHHLGAIAQVRRFLTDRESRGNGTSILSPTFLGYLQSNFIDDPSSSSKVGTGMIAVLWAVHACRKVDTYGFTAGAPNQKSNHFGHYFDTGRTKHKGDTIHNWEIDHELHDRLERARAVTRHHAVR